MKHHLNTLFVFTQDAYLSKDGEAVAVKVEKEVKLRLPIHNLGGIVCFGRVNASPYLMAMCAEQGVAISFCTEHGRFLARYSGFTPGNVLLRRQQYRWADDPARATEVVRSMLLGKLANSRTVLLRAAREHTDPDAADRLSHAAAGLSTSVETTRCAATVDELRGIEGDAAHTYFAVFQRLIRSSDPAFTFSNRTRRPPLDRVNALLSFLYAMLAHDARTACEACGLDPAVGYLHLDRPGRPGLALDLMEEFRAFLADRLAISLINLGQVKASGFTVTESGAVEMSETTRKEVVAAYQRRKQESIVHPFLNERTTVGLLVHLQARLLARFIRGDLDAYPPFIWK
ncbi:MAG: type I-C CRISPR-associated endonuclease Cas1 [Phycisphaeraceae bacterium]|nr:type I-C CRISPR-associated endonuclease Cas1 [Phycisphaeraceae bacterium]MCW5769248.1 type I-C CRISPR-associated endonuclease Cas1 [Phycisphaeraceae bacterium]